MKIKTLLHKSGFILIELLFVIAIIAILAAILFPVFARARENARRTSCQSNMKQIGLGLLQYSQDYDEFQPRTNFGGTGATNWPTKYKWMDAIYPYVKNEQIFTCPSDTTTSPTNKFRYSANYPGQDLYYFGSYAYNNGYYGYQNTAPANVNLSAIQAPSTTVWIVEQLDGNNVEVAWGNAESNPSISVVKGINVLVTPASDIPERHLETTTILYCDGHVKSVKLSSLVTTKSVVPYGGFTPMPLMTAFTIQDD